jgi:lipopolysaccharide export system permease protein
MPTKTSTYLRRSFFKPTRLDLYILGEVLGPFAGGILFFLFIFLMFQLLRLAEMFIVHGVPTWTLVKMVSLLSISFLPTAIPVAFLIAVLVAFGRLSADSELVAMKSCGIGIGRLSLPVLALAVLLVGLSLGLNMNWVPWSGRAFKSTLVRLSNTKVVSSIREGAFTTGFFDLLIFADKVDTKTNRLKRVFIFDEREPKQPLAVVAQAGEIVPVKTSSELGAAALLKLYNGSIHRNDLQGNTYQKVNFGEYKLFLKISEGADTATFKPEMIPYRELTERIDRSDVKSYEGREMRGEFWRRYALAISPLIFVFFGIGFGTVRTRAVRAGAALVAFVTILTYWVVQTSATIAVQKALIPPALALQLPNLLLLFAAFFAFRRASW